MLRSDKQMARLRVLILTVLIAAAALGCSIQSHPEQETAVTDSSTAQTEEPSLQQTEEPFPVPSVTEEPEAKRYVLSFAGDCTFGGTPSNYYAQVGFVKTVGNDYRYPFANVISRLENDDFTVVNLEGPLCDTGHPVKAGFCFRGPTDFVNILTENSIEAVTLANNHSMDYGAQGYASTRKVLEEAGVTYVEQDGFRVVTLEDGLTIGLYATSYSSVDREALITEISAMKQQGVDVIIYAAHWGYENNYRIIQEQEELAHAAIDAGASIVYGSHPHVLQPMEAYNGGVIFYSLGNFSFGGNTAPKDYDTALVQQEVLVGPDGSATLGECTVIPCSVSSNSLVNNYQPTPYEKESPEYLRVMEKLSGTYEGPNLKIG